MARVLDTKTAKIVLGHESLETAKLVQGYPYGRLTCEIKYWIEKNKRGMRFCSQTCNPKTLRWNKPKKTTYCEIMLMVIDDSDFVSYTELGSCSYSVEKSELFLSKYNDYLTDAEKETIEKGIKDCKIINAMFDKHNL